MTDVSDSLIDLLVPYMREKFEAEVRGRLQGVADRIVKEAADAVMEGIGLELSKDGNEVVLKVLVRNL